MNALPQRHRPFVRRQPQALALASFLAALALTHSLSATSLYWDPLGSAANSGTTATGAWNGTGTVWNTDSTGGAGGTVQAVTLSTDDLFFSSGTGYTGSSTVTFTGAVTANSITFEEGTVTLAGTSTPSLTLGAGGLTFNDGTGANIISGPVVLGANTTFTNNDNSTQTVSGAISGAFNLNLNATGTGAIALSGTNTSYSGTTTLTAGTLIGRNTLTTNVLNAFGTGGIVLNGGTLQLRANGSSNGGQTIVAGNNVTVGNNAVTVDVNNNGSNAGNNITFGNLSLGTGQLNVTGGNTYTLRFSGTTTLTGDAVFNPTTAGLSLVGVISDGGNNFGITKIGSGNLVVAGANTYTGTTSVLAGTLSLSGNAASGAAGTLGNATSAVLLGDTSGSANAMLNVNGDFTVGRDIVVQSGNTGVVTIGSTSTSVNSSTISGDIALGSGGTGHNAVFSTGDYHSMIYSGTISGLGGITTIGGLSTSKVIINGNNTYSGGTTMTTGLLRVGHNNALGTGAITINGGTLGTITAGITLANNQTWAGDFSGGISSSSSGQALTTTGTNTIAGGNRIISLGGSNLNINGTITDAGNNYALSFRNNASDGANASVTLGGANTFGGGLTIIGAPATRTLTVTTSTSTAAGSGQTTLTNASGSILKLNNALTVDSLTSGIATPTIVGGTGGTNGTQALVITGGGGSGATGTATISGGVITAVTITNYGKNYTSAPTIELSTPGGTGSITSGFGNSSVNLQANTLTLAGTNASPATYAGVISGTGGSLVKTGAGTQTLTGVNTYTGSTTVSGGKLEIAGTGSIGSTSGVTINGGEFAYNTSTALFRSVTVTGGVLSGTGTFTGSLTVNGGLVTSTGTAGDVTVNAGGAINPGNTGVAAAFSADTLTWNSNDVLSGLRFDLGADNAASDSIAVAGAFTKGSGSTFAFNFTDIGATASFTYTLLTFDSTDFNLGDFSASGVAGTFGLDANSLTFTVSAIPEPSATAALLGALVLTGTAWRRRRPRVA